MKEFFSRYSYDSVRMALDQVAISLFGFSLAMATSKTGNDTLLMITSLGAILFYLLLIFSAARKVGTHDKITVDLGHRKFKPMTGFWISLLANSVNLLLAIIGMILTFATGNGGIVDNIIILLNGMYQGVLALIKVGTATNFVMLKDCWWAYYLIILPALAVSTLGYIAGVKDWHLTGLSTPEMPESDRPSRKEQKEREKAEREKAAKFASRPDDKDGQ